MDIVYPSHIISMVELLLIIGMVSFTPLQLYYNIKSDLNALIQHDLLLINNAKLL